jgi:hypothetical protein
MVMVMISTFRRWPTRLSRACRWSTDAFCLCYLNSAWAVAAAAHPDAYAFQPENTLKLQPWTHDTNDTTLLDLIPFLLMVQEVGIRDVRDVVRSYDGEEDVAKAFKARMASLAASHSKGSGGSSIRLRGS